MRVLTKPAPRPARPRSLSSAVALVLAAVCLVQLHLLLRPRSTARPDAATDGQFAGHGSMSSIAGAAQEQQREQKQRGRTHEEEEQQQQQGKAAQQQQQQQQQASAGASTAAPTVDDALGAVRGAPLAFVSFANGAFSEFIENWVASVQQLDSGTEGGAGSQGGNSSGGGVRFLVGALDARMAEICGQRGWPYLDVSALVAGQSALFRTDFKTFRNMGATKVQLVLTMLEELQVDTVVVSDSDTSWLHNPGPYLASKPSADFFISTDCLSHEIEAAWEPKHNQPRCGHVAGNYWGRAYNTGVFAARNRPAARDLLARWRDFLLDATKATEVRPSVIGTVTLGITDQLAIHHILEENLTAFESSPEDPRITLHRNGALRLHALPVLQFPSGHAAFVQRLPWRHGVDPFVVHATFQRFATHLQLMGKRGRFREFGLWFLDGPEYYAPPGARYLTYDNGVRQYIDRLSADRFGGAMPLFYKHMVAMSYQLAQFRDALAAARMLNRTLVLPTSWCWCDYDWTPDVLEKCKIRGTDMRLPFACPADFVFNIPFMDQANVSYRVPGFLERPQVPEAVKRGRVEVVVLAGRPEQLPAADSGPVAALWPGMTQAELLQAVELLAEAAVLDIRAMQPGLLQGFGAPGDAAAFDRMFGDISKELYWCCAAVSNGEWANFRYRLPRPFSEGYVPWDPPVLAVPKYCDVEMDKRNIEYVRYANHPCSFLRNTTAAAIAAALS